MVFALLGGDDRSVRLCRLLRADGHTVRAFALERAKRAGIDTAVMNGSDPEELYKLLDGRQIGTLFKAKRGK